MRVRVEKTNLQELHEKALLSNANQISNFRRIAFAQLHAIDPFADEDSPRRQVEFDFWDLHVGHFFLFHQ